jgi:hypothetical protein
LAAVPLGVFAEGVHLRIAGADGYADAVRVRALLAPGSNLEPVEVLEVVVIRGDDHEPLGACDRGDLAVGKRRSEASGDKSGTLPPMPLCGRAIVREYRE